MTSALVVYRTAAHRKAVMQRIRATLLPSAFGFAVLAPLAGLTLIWGSNLVAMIGDAISTSGKSIGAARAAIWDTLLGAYVAAGVAAAITGVWVALLSPFAADNPRFYIGAAIVGMLNTYLFVSIPAGTPALFGGQLFLSLVGAVSAFVVAWLLQNPVLNRDEAHRDHLARERAERIARERAKA